ncbi:MAG: histidinol-phosphatase [Desulfobacterales bacterium]
MPKHQPQRVSIHGGHSGQFCTHAQDTLAEVIEAYIAQGFAWVGISEHMPPAHDDFRYPDEVAAGLSAAELYTRFESYMAAGRRLQARYRDQINIYIAMETEMYPGALELAEQIIAELKPDYVVGSVHHVAGFAFDFSAEIYHAARRALGSWEALYCRYFDHQYQLLSALRPRVVGHFDLIRIYDRDYPRHMALPAVQAAILRNLELIKDQGAILDFNLRALVRGAAEPYVSRPILELARNLGIPVVPGDDSHGVASVGKHLDEGMEILTEMGFDTNWVRPAAV